MTTPPPHPAPTPLPRRRPSPRPESSGSGNTADLVAAGLVRRTRILRGIAIGLVLALVLGCVLYVLQERGIIDIPVEWLSWIPWVDKSWP